MLAGSQSLAMAALPRVQNLGLGIVGAVYCAPAQNHTPTFFGKQLHTHQVLYSPWTGVGPRLTNSSQE